jgi:hypothetical protein
VTPADVPVPVAVQVRFERTPISVRGAFVMRGADGDPHSVRVEWARVERVPGGPTKAIVMEDRLIDLTPTRDLFVPFEVPVMELPPSWYRVACALKVDGARTCEFEGRPFVVPWPRAEVWRGTVTVATSVPLGRRSAQVDRVEGTWEASVVVWRAPDVAGGGEAVLVADDVELEVLPPEAAKRLAEPSDPAERRTLSYPVPRGAGSLSVVVRRGSERSSPIPLSL